MSGGKSPLRRASAAVAAAERWGDRNLDDLRRTLATEQLAAYVARIVAEAPPLTAAQRDRIAALLGGGEGG